MNRLTPHPDGTPREVRFCIACGTGLVPRDESGRERMICPDCGWIYYRNPLLAAGTIVERKGEILFVRRSIEPAKGLWCLPSGFQEYDETPEETAVRETREETGLEVRLQGLIGAFLAKDDPRSHVTVTFYRAAETGGTLRAGDDADEARFFPLDAPPEPLAFENHRRALAAYPQGSNLQKPSLPYFVLPSAPANARTIPEIPESDSGSGRGS